MERKYKFILGLALIHLLLVVCGILSINFSELSFAENSPIAYRFAKIVDDYGEASGSATSYGFFSPGIEGQFIVWFDLEDAQGKHTREFLPTDISHEAQLRIGCIVDQFQEQHDDVPAFQRAMTASFAAKMAQLHPDTQRITVHVDRYKSVSMEDFKRGKRVVPIPLYQATYVPPNVPPQEKTTDTADEEKP